MPDIQNAIQAILASVNVSAPERPALPSPVVCISRDPGSGGNEIAFLLSQRLGLPVYDREIFNRVADRLKADPHMLTALDAGAARWRDLWLFGALGAGNIQISDYYRQLTNVIIGVARSGGIILGRGAHLILARSGALRVRIAGSLPVCAGRIALREGIDLATAKQRVLAETKRRDEFLWDMFRAKLDDPGTFDAMLNTDRLADPARSVDVIVTLMELIRMPHPERT